MKYKAIFFDLDGTLLPMDTDEFLKKYFKAIAGFFASQGYKNYEELAGLVYTATKEMCKYHPGITNREAFWKAFCEMSGLEQETIEGIMDDFYNGSFNVIGQDCEEFTTAIAVLDELQAKGYPLYLTTMPLFPVSGVHNRLKWVGMEPSRFKHITTYENSYFIKPMPEYYQSCLDVAGVSADEVLMVGNHATEDLSITRLGCDIYLVKDHLLNPDNVDLSDVKVGSMEDLLDFVKALPDCE